MFQKWWKNLLLRRFIQNLYRENRYLYFPIFSHAPKYLNLAYPDFSIQYFILSLGNHESILLDGYIPRDKIVFWSICVYDDNALPMWSRTDADYCTNRYIIPINSTQPCGVILRFYVKEKYQSEDFYQYLPTITPSYERPRRATRISKTNALFEQMKAKVSSHFKNIDQEVLAQHKFFLPGLARRQALFTNPNAFYLAMFPETEKSIFTIELDTRQMEDMRFIGFMSCNRQTTETLQSVPLQQKKKYILHVCSKSNVKKVKEEYHPQYLLVYGEEPIIIYRLVIAQRHHGFLKWNEKKDDTSATTMEKKMKTYYPKVTYFT